MTTTRPIQSILGEGLVAEVFRGENIYVLVDAPLVWVVLDMKDKGANIMNVSFTTDLHNALDQVERQISDNKCRAVIFYSMKPNSFLAGADIRGFVDVVDQKLATHISREGQRLFNRITQLKVPAVAALNGTALGGGLELALACTYRVAAKLRNAQIGQPEVKVGVIPGAGGTVRLPRIVGLQQSLGIILSGGSINPEKAFRLGLVDKLFDCEDRFANENRFFHLVRQFAAGLTEKSPQRKYVPSKTLRDQLLNDTWLGRKVIQNQALKNLDKTTHRQYPAPYKALESVMYGYTAPMHAALEFEANAFGQALVTPECKNLVNIFLLTDQAKKVDQKVQGAKPFPIKKIGVIGAGVMGSGIAQIFAFKGYQVYMKDIKPEFVSKGMETVKKLFRDLVSRKRLTKEEADTMVARVQGGTENDGFKDCQLIVEAAIERMDLKKRILQDCEKVMSENCIFATNTSSLSITDLAAASSRPENVVGMHFFNPVHKMPLIEVIRSKQTSNAAVATIYQLALKLGKVPVICADGPGFIVNRILGIYMAEAGRMLFEGGDITHIDRNIVSFGLPMGPFRLMDEVGLDVAFHVGPVLEKGLGERFAQQQAFARMVNAGLLGKKAGKGFYKYQNGKSVGVEPSLENLMGSLKKTRVGSGLSDVDIVDRCILLMVNEAAYILQEAIAETSSDIDLAMIMGTGFAPFRGGLLAYADDRGLKQIVSRLEHFAKTLGPRFTPSPLLVRMVEHNERFFPNRIQVPIKSRL